MKRLFTYLLLSGSILLNSLAAQETITHKFLLSWSSEDSLSFEGAGEFLEDAVLPVYSYRFPLDHAAAISVDVTPEVVDFIQIADKNIAEKIPTTFIVGAAIEQERNRWFARVWLMPLVSIPGDIAARIIRGTLNIHTTPIESGYSGRSGPEFKQSSVLAEGVIHRVAVKQAGMYKIDYSFIKDKLKIDPSTINPSRIGIFGNGGGRIPQWSSTPRVDDLEQSASLGVGLEDGQFNQGDYLVWYAEGPEKWTFDSIDRIYNMELNNYDKVNHYYIIVNGPSRKSVGSFMSASEGDYISTASLEYQRMEDEKVNLLGRYRPPGSGQEWYGDEMAVVSQLDYSSRFEFSDIIPNDTFNYKVRFAARSANLSRFYLKIDDKEVNRTVGAVDLVNYESSFANDAVLQGEFVTGSSVEKVVVRYPEANGVNSRSWVDYIQFNFWRKNQYRQGSPLYLRDPRQSYSGVPEYHIDGLQSGCQIWNITDPLTPGSQAFNLGTTSTFVQNQQTTNPQQYVCFHPSHDVQAPDYEELVTNQNLHSLQGADLVIVYYDEFEEAALKLASHRRNFSNLEVVAVPTSQIFEEFGGGSMDPSAIRDFARMFYKRDPSFRYLCLLGDATYDYLNHFTDIPYQNFVPAFETEESLDPIRSFPSDDFYSLLDDDEGDNLIGAIDIAVGRLPVSTPEEAIKIVDKIIYYDINPATLNDWRSRIVMVADDEDGNIHLNQADGLALQTGAENPELNTQKVYLDAYPQESTPGGDRYPAVNEAIDLNMKKGALTVTYMGHGGQNGWTQERVLGINQAQSYDNLNNMPLFITATCSFAGYDEPGFTSAGEHLLLNPDGGAVALMTTVRAVYSGSNERLTRAVLKLLYTPDADGVYPSIAEVLRRAKNVNAIDTLDNNARKFTLLGDPSQKLAIPEYQIVVTEMQGHIVSSGEKDTLSALQKTIISGEVLGHQGELLTDFNGKIFITLFDKIQVRKTLANDADSAEKAFSTQNRQLFKGTASVDAGVWTIEFVLPKDIDFTYGPGKISMYAHDGVTDATGYFTDFSIGGVSEEGLSDDLPPVVKLFMNDANFLFGGITDPDPDIYIQLSDDNGINVSGTSIGHDIEAILDGDDRNSLILNDFYQAVLNDYTNGEVRYPLSALAPGLHTLKVIAWDLANNPGEAYIEFIVLDSDGPVIEDLFNYPNPFSDLTYFQFEHNRPGVTMDLDLDIYDLSGRFVKNISKEDYVSDGYRVDDIEWNGQDNQRNELGPGIYVYKLKLVYTNNGVREVIESDAEKLVIIR